MNFKSKIKKILIFIFVIILLSNLFPSYCDDLDNTEENESLDETLIQEASANISEKTLNLNSRYCVVLDRISKQKLFGKSEDKQVKMASTTKIMTAIVVLENYDLNKQAEISKKAASTGGSRLGLKTGDKITIHDLLYGLMLCSGNDAAVALAENVAGSIPQFLELMNKKAQDLNLTHTHFESPHGLDSDDHYTTAYELALLSDYALKNSTFAKIVGTKTYTITLNGYSRTLSNTNELLGNLNGIYGIKTGFTNGANRCLVTACKRGNMDIICVVLGADTKKFRTQDSIKLIEYSFKNYEYINAQEIAKNEFESWKKNNLNNISIYKGVSNNIELELNKSEISIFPIKKEQKDGIQTIISFNTNMAAPINKGNTLGNMQIISDNNIIYSVDILASNDICKRNIIDYLNLFIKNYTNTLENIIFV